MQKALEYKQKGLYTLRQAVSSPILSPSRVMFAHALALALDEVRVRFMDNMQNYIAMRCMTNISNLRRTL
jgi:hypothetical protein